MGIGQRIGEELRDFINPQKRIPITITKTYNLSYQELANIIKINEPIKEIKIIPEEKKIIIITNK